MTWRDRLLDGYFRGVPFELDGSAYASGRRTATHEFPGRDTPFTEDLGRAGRTFNLEAHVIGPDYDILRDRLREALEEEGPGPLDHPYYGSLTVQVGTVSLRESTDQGGMATFSIAFHEAGDVPSLAEFDTAAALEAAANKSIAESIADFGDNFDALDMAADLVTGLEDDLNEILDAVEGVVEGASSSAAALIRAPANMAASISGSLNRIRALAEIPLNAFNLYAGLFNAAPSRAAITTTPSRKQQAASQTALTALIQQVALAEAANVAAGMDFDSAGQAGEIRDAMLDALDTQAETANDAAYLALMALRAAIVQDASARGANLARVVSYTPPATMSALVLAHRLYGDATRADEISARNNASHPGFLPGGELLEVLNA